MFPLLEDLHRAPVSASCALLVRHAERGPIASSQDIIEAPLTTAGVAAAEAFGGTLGRFRALRAHHSPIPRCGQTAQAVARGFRGAGGHAEVGGDLEALGGFYLRDTEAVVRAYLADHAGFVRAWFDGRFPPSVIASRRETARTVVDGIAATMADRDPATLHVFVTHDWNAMAVREELLGVRIEDGGWIDFLDGVALWFDNGRLILRYRAAEAEDLP